MSLSFQIEDNDFYYIKSLDPCYAVPLILILFYSRNEIPWSIRSISLETKIDRKKIRLLLTELRSKKLLSIPSKKHTKKVSKNINFGPLLGPPTVPLNKEKKYLVSQSKIKEKNDFLPVDNFHLGPPMGPLLGPPILHEKKYKKIHEKYQINDKLMDGKKINDEKYMDFIKKNNYFDSERINESSKDKIILKQQEYSSLNSQKSQNSLIKCLINGSEFNLLEENNIYIKSSSRGMSKHREETDRCIIIIPENDVKYFRHISFILLQFYNKLFKLDSKKEVDKVNFNDIKSNIEKEYGYSYLTKAMIGYTNNKNFMKINDKPMIKYIFKNADRIHGLVNDYYRSKKSIEIEERERIIECPLYRKDLNKNKISFCKSNFPIKDGYILSGGMMVCDWHYKERIAMKNQTIYSSEANWVKIFLTTNNSLENYIQYIKKEYGNNKIILKWIEYLIVK